MTKEKKKGYSILFIATIVFTLMAISTLIPQSSASKVCALGYRAHCTFTPWSTLICLALSAISCTVRAEFFVKKEK